MATESKTSSLSRARRRERMRRALPIGMVLAAAAAATAAGSTRLLLATAVLALAWLAFLGSAQLRGHRGRPCREAPLFARDQLIAIGNHMLARCRNRSQPFTVAVVEVTELPEVRKLFGRRAEAEIVATMEGKLRAAATSRGLAVRTGATQFSLLLPGRDAEGALHAVGTALGRAGCLEHETGGEELVLLPDVKLEAVPSEHAGIGATYRHLCQSVAVMQLPAAACTATATSDLPTEPGPVRAAGDAYRPTPDPVPTVPL